MLTIGFLIPADQDVPIQLAMFNCLEDFQAAVDGRVEMVDLPMNFTLMLNEDGVALNLPGNLRATIFLWRITDGEATNQVIYGDVVVVGHSAENGRITDVPMMFKEERST